MDMPSILLTLNENATHKISEQLSYADARIIVEYVKELQQTLNKVASSQPVSDRASREDEVELLNIKVSNLLMLKTKIPVESLVDIVMEIDSLYKPYLHDH